MKTITKILLLSMVVFGFACKKADSGEPTALTGKWKLTERYISTGGPGQWTPATGNDYVQFANNNGTVSGTVFSDYIRYAIKDSVTVVFFKNDQTQQNYRYTIKNGVLQMGPAGPIYCIEGCDIRFTKEN
jgi:hypothetical protein